MLAAASAARTSASRSSIVAASFGMSHATCGVAATTSTPAFTCCCAIASEPPRSAGPSSIPGSRWQCRSITLRMMSHSSDAPVVPTTGAWAPALPDEVAHLPVDALGAEQREVAEAGDLRVRRPRQDRAGVGVDDLVAGRPEGAVADCARRLVAFVQRGQERRFVLHVVARGGERRADVGEVRAVVRPADRDP